MIGLLQETVQNDEPNAVYGIYKDGNIVLDRPVKTVSNSRVVVLFLDQQKTTKPKLADFFDFYGAWEDDRDADTIIADIYTARHSKPDIQL
jgi:hypothetical protein